MTVTTVVEVLAALAAIDRAIPSPRRVSPGEAKSTRDTLAWARRCLRAHLPDLTPRPPGTTLARLPVCPAGHGPLQYRPPGTREQAWCGTWFTCHRCRSSVLWPSPALRAQDALLALAAVYALTDLADTPTPEGTPR